MVLVNILTFFGGCITGFCCKSVCFYDRLEENETNTTSNNDLLLSRRYIRYLESILMNSSRIASTAVPIEAETTSAHIEEINAVEASEEINELERSHELPNATIIRY